MYEALTERGAGPEDGGELTVVTHHVRIACSADDHPPETVNDFLYAGKEATTTTLHPATSSAVLAAPSRTVPPPEPSIPPSFGYPAFYAAKVGDCVRYVEAEGIDGMVHARCEDPRVNAQIRDRTIDPEACPNDWVGAYEPQNDYSKPIPYELVLCLGPTPG